jgi:hypothetical protein
MKSKNRLFRALFTAGVMLFPLWLLAAPAYSNLVVGLHPSLLPAASLPFAGQDGQAWKFALTGDGSVSSWSITLNIQRTAASTVSNVVIGLWNVDGATGGIGSLLGSSTLTVPLDLTPSKITLNTSQPLTSSSQYWISLTTTNTTPDQSINWYASSNLTKVSTVTRTSGVWDQGVTNPSQPEPSFSISSANTSDTTPPVISVICTPSRLSRPGGPGFTILVRANGTAYDALSGIAVPTVGTFGLIDSNGKIWADRTFNVGARGAYSFNVSLDGWLLPGYTNRIYTVQVRVPDRAGNIGTGSATVMVGH